MAREAGGAGEGENRGGVHRTRGRGGWALRGERRELAAAGRASAAEGSAVVGDGLAGWLSNLMRQGRDVEAGAEGLSGALEAAPAA